MNIKPLKIAATSLVIIAFAAGTAMAGDKAGCKDKKTAMKTEAAVTATAATNVLAATERADAKAKMKKVYTFDQAMELCQKKGADDLQACIDYKTGKTTPKS